MSYCLSCGMLRKTKYGMCERCRVDESTRKGINARHATRKAGARKRTRRADA